MTGFYLVIVFVLISLSLQGPGIAILDYLASRGVQYNTVSFVIEDQSTKEDLSFLAGKPAIPSPVVVPEVLPEQGLSIRSGLDNAQEGPYGVTKVLQIARPRSTHNVLHGVISRNIIGFGKIPNLQAPAGVIGSSLNVEVSNSVPQSNVGINIFNARPTGARLNQGLVSASLDYSSPLQRHSFATVSADDLAEAQQQLKPFLDFQNPDKSFTVTQSLSFIKYLSHYAKTILLHNSDGDRAGFVSKIHKIVVAQGESNVV